MTDQLTKTTDLFIPEVWSDLIEAEFQGRTLLANTPAVRTSNDLVGRPGDTVIFPKWARMDGMQDLVEGEAPELRKLTQTRQAATVKGVGNAFQWTDESALMGIGDVQVEGTRQLGIQYARKVDEDLIKVALEDVAKKGSGRAEFAASNPLKHDDKVAEKFSWGLFVDAVASLGDSWDPTQWAAIVIRSEAQAALMKDDQFINASKLGAATALLRGQIGVIGGVPVITHNGVPENTAMMIKPGSLGLLRKRDPLLEYERVPGKRINQVWFSAFYAVKRLNDNGVLKITHKAPAGVGG